MSPADPKNQPNVSAEIFDFDEALLDRCTPQLRAELLTEASMVAQVFAPEASSDDLVELARVLSSGRRDGEIGRARARKLAAALRHLAKDTHRAKPLSGTHG